MEGAPQFTKNSLLSSLQLYAGGFYLSVYEVYLWTILHQPNKAYRKGDKSLNICIEQWRSWVSEGFTMLPYTVRFQANVSQLLTWTKAWEQAGEISFVLESGKGGRYTFLGIAPFKTIQGKGFQFQQSERDRKGNWQTVKGHASPLDAVKAWMKPFRSPSIGELPKFSGGCTGFWGYDVVRTIENIPELASDDLPIPEYMFALYDRIWVWDHQENEVYACVHSYWSPDSSVKETDREELLKQTYSKAKIAAEEMVEFWRCLEKVNEDLTVKHQRNLREELSQHDLGIIDSASMHPIRPAFDEKAFVHAVRRVQDYIRQGDVFQVNLSVRAARPLEASPEEIYESLRVINPSPYMGLMRFERFALISGSPELLVQLEEGKLRTRPIAGTRPRGKTAQEDDALAEELLANEKERAEHVMLVDLERNDLGRISRYGSVKVDEFMVIEKYSHVMHIVSEVTGELAPGKDAFDVIAATFPGGTITGAPKVRTMEILEELEPVRRGPYTGSMGWIDYNGNMEFNIVIRTLLAAEGLGYVQAGAGIVIDSVPEREYVESLNKAKAMWKAAAVSEGMKSRV